MIYPVEKTDSKTLVEGGKHAYIPVTQFARACGRVSVGGHPDKRPDSRLELYSSTQRLTAGGETGKPGSPPGT